MGFNSGFKGLNNLSYAFQVVPRVHPGKYFHGFSDEYLSFDFVIIIRSKWWRQVTSKFNLKKLLIESSLQSKKQLLNSRHLAAVGSQQSVGYEQYVDIVSKTDRLCTCATDRRAKM